MAFSEITLNRRNFLKGVALAGAGAMAATGLSACAPGGESSDAQSAEGGEAASGDYMTAETWSNAKWSFEVAPEPVPDDQITTTHEADIIVIGAGVSGLACAASATEEGADVILFAASSQPVARGGSNHGIGTKIHERLGIKDYTKDTITGMFKNEFARNGYRIDQKKWWKWANHSAETMNWLIDLMEAKGYTTTMEIGYEDTDGTFTAKPGSHNWVEATDGVESGAATGENLVIAMYAEKILEQGGQIHYDTIAQYLIRDDNNTGRVSAVVAKDPDGNYVKYVGRKAIVMATGDFSADRDMMAKYCNWVEPLLQYNEVDYNAMFTFGGLGPGDGQKMGLWVGAAWQNCLPNAPMIDAVGPMPYRQSIADFSGLLLNKKGQRYSNEDVIFSYGTYAMMMQPEMCRYGFWDTAYAKWFPQWETFGTTIVENEGKNATSQEDYLAQWNKNADEGSFFRADTIDELLEQIGDIDVETAKASIERYNELCEAKYDEDFHKDASLLAPIKEGPFFACKLSMSPANFLCVTGGLRTNENMQVCDANDNPIEGLYNLGIMVGDSYGNCYNFAICGHNLGMNCNTLAYMLGKDLASA
ncbi:MAG TPA: FAD-dependent oxidoreductase [Slackia equolifaciens]|uniref:FAD-dependent oxidoreductase n=1 Tax=Slackia equolifaciens TaxID=498718 RepID=A0A9D2UXD9_9ACTN|nr:FAD-dependent oxidoreductase [Slackia equolifaciens]